jgi:hypothetical protein
MCMFVCVCVCFTPLRRLLKTYSELGWYVRPLVLTVKHWAKRRKINDASSGTLSSYAYVILVIHFLQTRGLLPDLQADDPWQAAADGSRGGGAAGAAAAVQRAPVYDPVSGFNYAFAEGPHGNPPRSPAAPEGQHRHPIEVRKRRFCGMLILKTIILPRLARDKHRKKPRKEWRSCRWQRLLQTPTPSFWVGCSRGLCITTPKSCGGGRTP